MTVEGLINKLTEFCSWLYYRNWERWEQMAIAIVAVAVLLLIVRAKQKAWNVKKRIREHSPIIGIKLARQRGKQEEV
ncbi:MAG: hypothetical protein ACYTBP_03120 [Planctomycetota bacterium]